MTRKLAAWAFVALGLCALLLAMSSRSLLGNQERDSSTPRAPQAHPSRIESKVENPMASAPYSWIAASEILDEGGSLREDLIFGVGRPWERRRTRFLTAFAESKDAAVRAAAGQYTERLPCYGMNQASPLVHRTSPPPRNLNELARRAVFSFWGMVTKTEPGFNGEFHAVTALTIRVESWLVESPYYPARDVVFTLYPAANFYLGALEICSSRDGFPEPPRVGDIVSITHSNTSYWEARAASEDPNPFIGFANGFYATPDGEPRFTEHSSRFSMLTTAPSIEVAIERLASRVNVRGRR